MGAIQMRVDAEARQIVEPLHDPLEVACAVAVRVLKGAWVDLVGYADLPPKCGHANGLRHGRAHTISLLGFCTHAISAPCTEKLLRCKRQGPQSLHQIRCEHRFSYLFVRKARHDGR